MPYHTGCSGDTNEEACLACTFEHIWGSLSDEERTYEWDDDGLLQQPS